jgi:hypothetical protein
MESTTKKMTACFGVLMLSALVGTFALTLGVPSQAQEQLPRKDKEVDKSGHEGMGVTNYWTLKVNDKNELVMDEKKRPSWVKSKAPEKRPAPQVRMLAGSEAVVNVNCRTTPTDSSGRKTCNDDEVHTLPPGWVFAQNEVRTVWHSDIGSSNTVDVSWDDYVEIIPGSGYRLPRTMRVHGHARSGHGQGERGHTDATVYCRFFSHGG